MVWPLCCAYAMRYIIVDAAPIVCPSSLGNGHTAVHIPLIPIPSLSTPPSDSSTLSLTNIPFPPRQIPAPTSPPTPSRLFQFRTGRAHRTVAQAQRIIRRITKATGRLRSPHIPSIVPESDTRTPHHTPPCPARTADLSGTVLEHRPISFISSRSTPLASADLYG